MKVYSLRYWNINTDTLGWDARGYDVTFAQSRNIQSWFRAGARQLHAMYMTVMHWERVLVYESFDVILDCNLLYTK